MYVVKVTGFNAAHEAIESFLDSRDTTAMGKAAKDVARASGQDMGFSKAYGQILMFLAAEERIRKVQLLLGTHEEVENVPAPAPFEIEAWLEKHRHEYRKIYNEVSRGATSEERAKNNKIGRERQEAYLKNVLGEWTTHIVWPEEIAASYEGRRRALIRSGKMEPLPSDVDWLKEELAAMSAVTTPLQKLVAKATKAGLPNV